MILRTAKRVAVFVIGMTVLLIGVVMIVAPGPAVVVIPIGLAILATEFAWAAHLLKRMKDTGSAVLRRKKPPGEPDARGACDKR